MGDIALRQAFPLRELQQISPFILLHHFDFIMEPGNNKFNVPPHPHRGFCPITFMFEGSVEHNDSLGNHAVISDNEVQWINAGSGLIHSEIAAKKFVESGGRFQGIQLWINLKRAEKMLPPSYQSVTKNEIILFGKEGVEFRLVSGNYQGKKGPANSDVITATLRMLPNTNYDLSFPAAQNVVLYILEGSIEINQQENAKQHDLVWFDQEDGEIKIKSIANSKLLVLSGLPIEEPLVSHGPFVMNSPQQILEAITDYQDGKMGTML